MADKYSIAEELAYKKYLEEQNKLAEDKYIEAERFSPEGKKLHPTGIPISEELRTRDVEGEGLEKDPALDPIPWVVGGASTLGKAAEGMSGAFSSRNAILSAGSALGNLPGKTSNAIGSGVENFFGSIAKMSPSEVKVFLKDPDMAPMINQMMQEHPDKFQELLGSKINEGIKGLITKNKGLKEDLYSQLPQKTIEVNTNMFDLAHPEVKAEFERMLQAKHPEEHLNIQTYQKVYPKQTSTATPVNRQVEVPTMTKQFPESQASVENVDKTLNVPTVKKTYPPETASVTSQEKMLDVPTAQMETTSGASQGGVTGADPISGQPIYRVRNGRQVTKIKPSGTQQIPTGENELIYSKGGGGNPVLSQEADQTLNLAEKELKYSQSGGGEPSFNPTETQTVTLPDKEIQYTHTGGGDPNLKNAGLQKLLIKQRPESVKLTLPQAQRLKEMSGKSAKFSKGNIVDPVSYEAQRAADAANANSLKKAINNQAPEVADLNENIARTTKYSQSAQRMSKNPSAILGKGLKPKAIANVLENEGGAEGLKDIVDQSSLAKSKAFENEGLAQGAMKSLGRVGLIAKEKTSDLTDTIANSKLYKWLTPKVKQAVGTYGVLKAGNEDNLYSDSQNVSGVPMRAMEDEEAASTEEDLKLTPEEQKAWDAHNKTSKLLGK